MVTSSDPALGRTTPAVKAAIVITSGVSIAHISEKHSPALAYSTRFHAATDRLTVREISVSVAFQGTSLVLPHAGVSAAPPRRSESVLCSDGKSNCGGEPSQSDRHSVGSHDRAPSI